MHYIGSAINRRGQIYTYAKDGRRYRNINKLNLEWIIDSMGTFSIPIDLLHVLQVVGSFVTDTHSIIFRWAEFTSQLSKDYPISTSDMITLLKSDINEREIAQARNYYSDMCLAIYDKYPVNKGHVLVIPKRHVINYFDLKQNETDSIWNLVNEVKEIFDLKYNPQGYNIGFNVGTLCTKKCT